MRIIFLLLFFIEHYLDGPRKDEVVAMSGEGSIDL